MGPMIRVLFLCAFLAGCQTPQAGFCSVAEPIRLSPEAIAAMSDSEVKTALAHNRLGSRLCGWKA